MNLSVIMSVYNGERYLREAIDSILNQTYSDFEFIIIDDCSTDSSAEIILSYRDDRIIFIQNEKNIGLTKSLNFAINISKGEFIARVDHDDVCLPDRFEKQIDYLHKHQDIQILCTEAKCVDEKGIELDYRNRIKTSEDIYYYLHFINPVMHPTVMFKRAVLVDEGMYNETYRQAQDFELWNRLKLKYKFAKLNEPLMLYRKSEGQISNSELNSQSEFAQKVFFSNMIQIGLTNYEMEKVKYFHNAFSDDYKNISISKLKLLKKINKKILNNTPDFLVRKFVRKAARKVYMYYLSVFLKKFKVFNPLISFLKKTL